MARPIDIIVRNTSIYQKEMKEQRWDHEGFWSWCVSRCPWCRLHHFLPFSSGPLQIGKFLLKIADVILKTVSNKIKSVKLYKDINTYTKSMLMITHIWARIRCLRRTNRGRYCKNSKGDISVSIRQRWSLGISNNWPRCSKAVIDIRTRYMDMKIAVR